MFFHRWLHKETSQKKGFFREEKGAVILLWGLVRIRIEFGPLCAFNPDGDSDLIRTLNRIQSGQ